MSKIKTAALCILSLVLLVSSDCFSQTSCTSCSTGNCSPVSVTVTSNGTVIYSNPAVPWVQGMNVTVAVYNAASSGRPLSLQTTQYCPYGSFINSINNISPPSGSYWALYVNGVYASYGVDLQKVNALDKISFVLTTFSSLKGIKPKSHQTLYFTHAESLKK